MAWKPVVDSPNATFTILWEIDWAQFRELPTKQIKKDFTTAHNNVAYFWSVEIGDRRGYNAMGRSRFQLDVYYKDGPLATLNGVTYKSFFLFSEDPDLDARFCRMMTLNYQRGGRVAHSYAERVGGRGYILFDVKDFTVLQERFGSRSVICQLTLEIPMEAFHFKYDIPGPIPTSQWVIDLFKGIEDQSDSSNAKLVSRDDRTFYCHQLVLKTQSPALAAMFRHPLGKGQKKDTYPFPKMGADSLKNFLEFLYTGKVDLTDVSTAAIFETADAAKMYGLTGLMETCRAALWDRIVGNVADCVNIIMFSDLHEEEYKYLKHRGFEIMAKNYPIVVQEENTNLVERFGGGKRGEKLADEYNLYVTQRVQGYFSMKWE